MRASQPGRMHDTAVRLLEQVVANPLRGDDVVRRGLRDARYLHSRERRLVADGIAGVLRHRRLFSDVTGSEAVDNAWLRWLVACGLDPGPLEPSVAWSRPLHDAVPDDAIEAAGVLGNLTRTGAAELVRSLDEDVWAFLDACTQRAPVTLRANTARNSRDALLHTLIEGGIAAEPTRWAPDGIVVHGRPNLRPLASDGLFEVQDEASQLCVELVQGRGPTVDWCAGAGGKTLAMASRWPRMDLVACDVRRGALERLKKRAKRASARVRVGAIQGRRLPGVVSRASPFATVLVDAPCSGSGVWRRSPSLREALTAERLESLTGQQSAVIRAASAHVRVGGRLVYATCSVLRAENEDIVDALEREREDLVRVDVRTLLPDLPLDGPDLRLSPHLHGTDGFFAAVLERR